MSASSCLLPSSILDPHLDVGVLIYWKAQGMDGDKGAATEQILLEPYKYLLQLPGEVL